MASGTSHALIFGASGIPGWAILNQARSYPTPRTFRRITGTTNQPLTLEKAQIPPDPQIRLVSGIDLTRPIEEVCETLKDKIEDVASVSHVFFTGGKGYGLEFTDHVKITPPLKESLPRIPKPWYDDIFYYSQYDILQSLSQGKNWTFSEVRSDGIVGFVPGSNAMNLARGVALYLTLYAAVNGKGASVPFPGTEKGWKSRHSDTSQDIMPKIEIHAALNLEKCGEAREFNIADGRTVHWAETWPRICEYFGLLGSGPLERSEAIEEFVKRNEGIWDENVRKEGLLITPFRDQNWGLVHFMFVGLAFDREYDLSRSREVGFTEEIDTVDGYRIAFERTKKAGILPA